MPTRNVNLTAHFHRFVDDLVESGQYKNASEVMRAGLHLLQQQTELEAEKLAVLRSLANEGFRELDQGRGIPISAEGNELSAAVARIGLRAASRATKKNHQL